jgi:hypothetical protein
MVDRIAKESGVTLTAEARKLLAAPDDPMSARGRVEKGVRWLVTRVVPGLATVDTTVHLVTTLTAAALLQRYFEVRPKSETGAVVDGFEATRVRRALKVALDFASAEHARGFATAVTTGTGTAIDRMRSTETSTEGSKALAERVIAAVRAGASAIPVAWIDTVEAIFWREFDR